MGLFDQFPYTNFHELNLDWILNALRELEHTIDQFVAINALKYADPIQWNIVSQYEKNTIVIDPLTGTAYISVQPVPSGVALTNTDYWTVVFDLGSFVTKAAKNFTDRWEEATTLTATFPTQAGEWLIWGDTLYKALVNITAGDTYVINSNIEHFTMEDTITQLLTIVGDLADLTTSDTSNLVNAINSVVTDFNNKIGDLVDLNTTDKTSIVNAINEVNTTGGGALALIGDLDDLTTYETGDLVQAINSTNTRFITPEMFGAVGDGVTDDTSALQDCFDFMTAHGAHVVSDQSKKYLISAPIIINNDYDTPPSIDLNMATITTNTDIACVLNIKTHAHGGQIRNILIDCNETTAIGVKVDDCMHGEFETLRIIKFTSIGMQINQGYEVLCNKLEFFGKGASSVGIEMNTSDSMFNEIVIVNCHYGFSKTNSHNNFSNIHCWIANTAPAGTITDSAMFVLDGNYCQFVNINVDTVRYGFKLQGESITNIKNVTLYVNTGVTSNFAMFHASDAKHTRSVTIDGVCGWGSSYQFATVNWLGRAENVQLYGFTDVNDENFVMSATPTIYDSDNQSFIMQSSRYEGNIVCHNGQIQIDNAVAGTDVPIFTIANNGKPSISLLCTVGISATAWQVHDVCSLFINGTSGVGTVHIPAGYSGTVYITYQLCYPCINGNFNS